MAALELVQVHYHILYKNIKKGNLQKMEMRKVIFLYPSVSPANWMSCALHQHLTPICKFLCHSFKNWLILMDMEEIFIFQKVLFLLNLFSKCFRSLLEMSFLHLLSHWIVVTWNVQFNFIHHLDHNTSKFFFFFYHLILFFYLQFSNFFCINSKLFCNHHYLIAEFFCFFFFFQ